MNAAPGNSGFDHAGRRGPSGLPVPGSVPSRAELKRRMAAYLDGELTPAERAEADAHIAADPVVLPEFQATRRAMDLLKSHRPSPDLTASILDELDRRRRLLGAHRHARRRLLRGLMTGAGALALLAIVLTSMDFVLPQEEKLAAGPAAISDNPMQALLAVPPVMEARADRITSGALELGPTLSTYPSLRWTIAGADPSSLVLGSSVDPATLPTGPLETTWTPASGLTLWPGLAPNASITRPLSPAAALAAAEAAKARDLKDAKDKNAGPDNAGPDTPAAPVKPADPAPK